MSSMIYNKIVKGHENLHTLVLNWRKTKQFVAKKDISVVASKNVTFVDYTKQ